MVVPSKRSSVQAVRRCGINKADTKPMKKQLHSKPVEPTKFNTSKPSPKVNKLDQKPNGLRKSYYLGLRTRKVKFYDPFSEVQSSEDKPVIVSQNEDIKRKNIQHAMAVFDEVYEQFCQENKTKPKSECIMPYRVSIEVAKIVKKKLKWVDPGKVMGPVCGVRIGDKFKYRSQLKMIGLHGQPQSGIDYVNVNGNNVAISIVDAHRYSNESESSDTLVYSGEGGNCVIGSKSPPEDQKLRKGNLALKISMYMKTKVRVIRKVEGAKRYVFVYDGLYIVDNYTKEKSEKGKNMYKFHLKRLPGQPLLHKMLKW
ncbi:YDG domain-containing protein At5g47150-like [Bidens hawaiensis]|uniref:YDG domain-containing protein At5g47150-like n=1 Tax=Bidens hawaiensis TaxID=980011 RepID=UPI00404AC483